MVFLYVSLRILVSNGALWTTPHKAFLNHKVSEWNLPHKVNPPGPGEKERKRKRKKAQRLILGSKISCGPRQKPILGSMTSRGPRLRLTLRRGLGRGLPTQANFAGGVGVGALNFAKGG